MCFRAVALSLVLIATGFAFDGEHDHSRIAGEKIGTVNFPVTCAPASRTAFSHAVAKLHSFWYEEAEHDFNAIAAKDPACSMAYWGVAMSNFHPLWYPPNAAEAGRAQAALAKAKSNPAKTARERAYVAAIDAFFSGYKTEEHRQRAQAYATAMEALAKAHPRDNEASIFYALALLGTASPSDKSFANQKQAGALLEPLFKKHPKHPGLAHYIIHSYDYTALAPLGLNAARAYAKIAPSVPHALHMPSHIFIRLGLWDEAAKSNEASAQAARNYEAKTQMGDGVAWDQRLHALDYLEYAYLQTGQLQKAKQVLDEVARVQTAKPNNTTAEYARAAVPARYLLEQQKWAEAAKLQVTTQAPEAQAITYWARAIGAARSGDVVNANECFSALENLLAKLEASPGPYPWHSIVAIQRLQAAGWIDYAAGKHDEALQHLRDAADLEDKTDKHPVTPGAVLPGREQLADMLMALGRTAEAAKEYEATLRDAPKRRRSMEALKLPAQVATK
jgi:tetratricopeptide (TPR) repeat protein